MSGGNSGAIIEAVLELDQEIQEGLGFKEGVYELTEDEDCLKPGEKCQYNGGECLEMARHFKLKLKAVVVEGHEIPTYRFRDVIGFLEQSNKEVDMCLPHLVKTVRTKK